MIQTAGDALLEDIIHNPADDGLRLILADWLQDHGEGVRAEFIRVQVEYAALNHVDRTCPDLDDYGRSEPRWKEGKCQCRGCVLRRRGRALCPLAPWLWIPDAFGAGFPGSPRAQTQDWPTVVIGHDNSPHLWRHLTFRRGFISTVRLPCQAWLEHGPALVRAQPLERVELADKRPYRGVIQWEPGKSPTLAFVWRAEDGGWTETADKKCQLDMRVFGLLRFDDPGRQMAYQRFYRQEDSAVNALSDALLAWAWSVTPGVKP